MLVCVSSLILMGTESSLLDPAVITKELWIHCAIEYCCITVLCPNMGQVIYALKFL